MPHDIDPDKIDEILDISSDDIKELFAGNNQRMAQQAFAALCVRIGHLEHERIRLIEMNAPQEILSATRKALHNYRHELVIRLHLQAQCRLV